eukprot:contig_40970_g9366
MMMLSHGDIEPGPLGCIRVALSPSRVVRVADATNATRTVVLSYNFLSDVGTPPGAPADAVAVIIQEVDVDGRGGGGGASAG